MEIHKLRSIKEFLLLKETLSDRFAIQRGKEHHIEALDEPCPAFRGYSYTAKKEVDFKMERMPNNRINWRETIVCPITGMINRWRATIQLFEQIHTSSRTSKIYISEQVTPLYNFLKSSYPNLIGSEYLGPSFHPGEIKDGIRHEDLTRLSFEDNSLDHCLTLDCLEHMPNPIQAFTSIYNKLIPGGTLCWSVPFHGFQEKNTQRAKINERGEVVHLLSPCYHGDPMGSDGILCYHDYGWEMLDQVRGAGFRDVHALLYWSEKYGYLGDSQLLFFAVK